MSIWKLLGIKTDADTTEEDPAEIAVVSKIMVQLDGIPRERARYVAMFSFILSRVAHADMQISAEETEAMERIVVEVGGLPAEQANIVVQLAKAENVLVGGTENFSVTHEFGRAATAQQKTELLECLFAVSASEEGISSAENQVIRQVADEMLLEHSDFIAVRSRFRDKLTVMRKPD